jgi:hypothetical protein
VGKDFCLAESLLGGGGRVKSSKNRGYFVIVSY